VVEKVVPSWEAISGEGPLAVRVGAEVWLRAMAVHAVRFTLVAQQAGSRGELRLDADGVSAPERLEMRVDVFVVVALQLRRFVAAFFRLEWAVIELVGLCGGLIKWVSPSSFLACRSDAYKAGTAFAFFVG